MRPLLTIAQFCEKHPWMKSQQMLRKRFRNRNNNGFKTAFIKDGRKILIDEKEFFRILTKGDQ